MRKCKRKIFVEKISQEFCYPKIGPATMHEQKPF